MKIWIALAVVIAALSGTAYAQNPRRQDDKKHEKKYKDDLPPKTAAQKAYSEKLATNFHVAILPTDKNGDLKTLSGTFAYTDKDGSRVTCSFQGAEIETGSWTTVCEDNEYYAKIHNSHEAPNLFFTVVYRNVFGLDPKITILYPTDETQS